MQLIQQTISCPWQPKHRKALQAGFSTPSSITGQPGTRTLLSELRSLLDTTRRQQLEQKLLLYKSLTSPTAPPAGVFLHEVVSGGYVWSLSLVAAPFRRLRSIPGSGTGGGDAEATPDNGIGQQQQQQQLALCIICRPAWATNLARVGSSSACTGSAGLLPSAAVPSLLKAAAEAVPDHEWADCSADAAAAAAATSTDLSSCCRVCRDIRSIAASKAAAAVTCHLSADASSSSSGSSGSSSDDGQGAARVEVQDVLVGVNVVAAPSASQLQGLVASNASIPPADAFAAARLAWSELAGAAYGLVPLDIACISSGSGNLVCGWACGPQERPAGAVQVTGGAAAAVGVAAVAAAAGGEAEAGAGDGSSSSSLVVGWQPELWSAVAYTGEVHWHCSLRLLSD
jgi:hypothetical protein